MYVDATGLLFLLVLVGVPAIVLACMPHRWRLACFFLGLALAFGTEMLVHSPHDPMAPMIFVGVGIAIAALLVEIAAFAMRVIRKRQAAARGELLDEKRPLRFWPKRR